LDRFNSPGGREPEAVDFESLLVRARKGDYESVGKMLEQCRDYLLLIANQDMDRDLQGKMGASDLVQESMLTAQAQFDRFEGNTREQFRGWLRGVLLNDVKHWRRHYKGTKKRNLRRELDPGGESSPKPEVRDPQYTPSTQAAADEEEQLLTQALSALPDHHRRVIQLRNWENRSFVEIGQELQCTPDAARKLWSRAIVKLQELLARDWPELNQENTGEQH
jgi:RNA polymerase sigma-70 factor (ECF subfamily)